MKYFFFIFAFCFKFILLCNISDAQNINDIKKQKEKSEKEIDYLNGLLKNLQNEKFAFDKKLNIIISKIEESKKVIDLLNTEISFYNKSIERNKEKIREMENIKKEMLDLYAKLIYGNWKKRNKSDNRMFILASSDFNQAYKRFKYLQQIQDYSKKQLQQIQNINDSLVLINDNMEKEVISRNSAAKEVASQQKKLKAEENGQKDLIAKVRKKEKNLRKKLDIELANRRKLEKRLDDLIKASAKKSSGVSDFYKLTPEEKLVSDNFEKNKGKLPWPVKQGFISEKFGINVHPVYNRVQMLNNGINITAADYSEVRAVFKGKVSEIIFMQGFNNVVIIRHGDYLTVYSNLSDVYVKKGEDVDLKQAIGKLAHDKDKGSIINFQIWKNTRKLNPEYWLAR